MSKDGGMGSELAVVGVAIPAQDFAVWHCLTTVEKWSEEACEFVRRRLGIKGGIASAWLRKYKVTPDEVMEIEGNLFLNEGIQQMWDLTIGAVSTNKFDNANSRIGIGDSSTAEAATQTDLQAATNKTYKAMNATYPSRTNQTVAFQSDFLTGDANYVWAEWVVDNGGTSGKTMNRKVQALGTKSTGTWTPTVSLTIA